MRRVLSTLTLLLMVVGMANAKPVTTSTARQVAATYLGIEKETLQPLSLPFATMHLFAIDGGGFVITSADDRMQPILAYSRTANFSFPIPDNLLYWLKGYDMQIRSVMDDSSAIQHPDWRLLASSKHPKAVYDTTMGPLLTTTWSQEPYYNSVCPSGAGGQTVTGCVATAMGQVMKYWNWPETGAGSHSYIENEYGMLSADFGATTYDWQHMPNHLTASSSSTEVDAVATLLYHCGVAVEMDYATSAQGGSGAMHHSAGHLSTPSAETALRDYFKYSPALTNIARRFFTTEEWAALLKNEIDHLRPVLYSGVSFRADGHEFVLDGYDTTGFFHFNWGWGSVDDGYYSLEDIHSYNDDQNVFINFEPDTLYGSTASCTVVAESEDTNMGYVEGGGTYMYREPVTLRAYAKPGYTFVGWSNGVHYNPYYFLAHDVTLQARYVENPVATGDTLAYVSLTDQIGVLFIDSTYRFGTRFPPEMLQGRDSIASVEVDGPMCTYVIRIFSGSETAPERLVYKQSFELENPFEDWHHFELEQHQPIAQDSSLWITMQLISSFVTGPKNTSIPDDNWISTNSGNNWFHLPDYQPQNVVDDTTISWFIRCITVSNPTGVSEVLLPNAELTVYPNPTSGTVSVTLPESEGTLHVYDTTGRLVESFKTDSSTVVFDAGRFPSGLYLLRHISPNGSSLTRLLVR